MRLRWARSSEHLRPCSYISEQQGFRVRTVLLNDELLHTTERHSLA